ncbi:MAG: TraR/DksA C4-type zinc finger protein [Alistipes sp.]|nr:TraR/DksA C4-type zinc finger protein [Alistipes sp.]
MAEEKTRYTDAELEEFRQLIEEKLAAARAEFEMLRSATSNENDTEDSSPTFKVLEEGAMTLSREEYGFFAQRQAKFIRNLEMALVRIRNKTYGICKTTGKLIPRERLLRVPHATECIEAKNARK